MKSRYTVRKSKVKKRKQFHSVKKRKNVRRKMSKKKMRGGGKDAAKGAFFVLTRDGKLICSVTRQSVTTGKDHVYILFATTDKSLVDSVMKLIMNMNDGAQVPTGVYAFDNSESPKVPCIMITGGMSKRGLLFNYVTVSEHTDERNLETFFSDKSANQTIELKKELEPRNGEALMAELKEKITALEYSVEDFSDYQITIGLSGFWATAFNGRKLRDYQEKIDNAFKEKHRQLAYNMRCIAGLYAAIRLTDKLDDFKTLQEILDNLKTRYNRASGSTTYWVGKFMNIYNHVLRLGSTASAILKVITDFETTYLPLTSKEKQLLQEVVAEKKTVDFIPENEQHSISGLISPDRMSWTEMKTFFEKLAATETPSGSSSVSVSTSEVVSDP